MKMFDLFVDYEADEEDVDDDDDEEANDGDEMMMKMVVRFMVEDLEINEK